MYGVNSDIKIHETQLIIGGKVFGIMGTDELRRDLAIGLLWRTSLTLFIGLVVSIAPVVAGLLYVAYAGYKGRKTDETMMRFNDVIYALPALPFFIILSITISNSIFVMVGFLMIFGWVGIAKVSRSMSLQIKTRSHIECCNHDGSERLQNCAKTRHSTIVAICICKYCNFSSSCNYNRSKIEFSRIRGSIISYMGTNITRCQYIWSSS